MSSVKNGDWEDSRAMSSFRENRGVGEKDVYYGFDVKFKECI